MTTVESVTVRLVAVGPVTNVESVAARGGGCGVDGSTASDDRGVGGRRPNRTNTVAVGPLTTVGSEAVRPIEVLLVAVGPVTTLESVAVMPGAERPVTTVESVANV